MNDTIAVQINVVFGMIVRRFAGCLAFRAPTVFLAFIFLIRPFPQSCGSRTQGSAALHHGSGRDSDSEVCVVSVFPARVISYFGFVSSL